MGYPRVQELLCKTKFKSIGVPCMHTLEFSLIPNLSPKRRFKSMHARDPNALEFCFAQQVLHLGMNFVSKAEGDLSYLYHF